MSSLQTPKSCSVWIHPSQSYSQEQNDHKPTLINPSQKMVDNPGKSNTRVYRIPAAAG